MTTLRKVKKFGIELEGGWDLAPRDARLFRTDGSVTVPGEWRVGEIVSPILTDWPTASDFLLVNYPDHTGASCGLHVHMSFGDTAENAYHLSLLADSEIYQTALLDRLRAVGQELGVTSRAFWSRLDGENQYCRTRWSPSNVQSGDRYRAVNFCAYERHGTIEIRVLPMFSKRQISVRMVREVLTFTDRYLVRADDAPFDVSRAFPLSGPLADDVPISLVKEVY